MRYGLRICSCSSRGTVRQENQDRFCIGRSAVGVFDGMGGERCGGEAAESAAEICRRDLAAGDFRTLEPAYSAIRAYTVHAQTAVQKLLEAEGADRGGTTAAILIFTGDGHALPCAIGDSRIYQLRRGALQCLTRDMTVAQQYLDDGVLSAQAARASAGWHMLRAYLGDGRSEMQLGPAVQLRRGDSFLVCTDGVSDAVDDRKLGRILRIPFLRLAGHLLRREAQKGEDNFTFILVRAGGRAFRIPGNSGKHNYDLRRT